MPDYDLGRAHGTVQITADTSGAQKALQDYTKATQDSSKASGDLSRVEQELSQRRIEAQRTAQARKDAEAEFSRVSKDATASVEEQVKAEEARNKARGAHLQATRLAAEAERAYRAALTGNDDATKKFLRSLGDLDDVHQRHNRTLATWTKGWKDSEEAITKVGKTLTSVLMPALKGIGLTTAGVGAVGALGLLGGGGIEALTAGLGGAAELVKDFSGALLLLPAVVAGAGAALGTLAVSFNGVGDALKAMDDPEKFNEAINKLAPAAAEVVRQLASFEQAFKGAGQVVQQAFFQPIVDQIQPLVFQWLPALMNAGKEIAGVFGQAARMLSQWLQQPAQMQAFQQFIQNVVQGMNTMLPALQPILNAFEKLVVVGSSFFPELAQIIDHIATSFNAWVQGATASGQLQSWIQNSITAFGQLWEIIKNTFDAFAQIGHLAGQSGGFLDFLVKITTEFNNWAHSVQGAQAITQFFNDVRAATDALVPILKILGPAFVTLLDNMMQLGVAMGPGLTSFFQSLAQALALLGQQLVAAGPSVGSIFEELGKVLLQIVQQIGPQLPHIFQTLAQTFIQLAPSAVAVAGAIADIMSHLTPNEVETILAVVAAFQAFSAIAPIISGVAAALTFLAANPIVLVIAGVALLVGGLIYAYNNFKTFHDAVDDAWNGLKDLADWLGNTWDTVWRNASNAINGVYTTLANLPDSIGNALAQAWQSAYNEVQKWFVDAQNWGASIMDNLIKGVKSMFQPLTDAASWVAQIFKDHLWTKSPADEGPLHDTSPNQMGVNLATNVAAGVRAGSPAVSSAAAGMASGFVSSGSGFSGPSGGGGSGAGFTSAGIPGSTGGGLVQGHSGFDQWVNSLTQDLSQWQKIFKESFSLFQDVAQIFVKATKIVASVWNGGDNPLTRPGGIAGPPRSVQNRSVPGVPDAETHGTAPMPELTPQHYQKSGTPAVGQQGVPGVPSASPNGTPPANPPAGSQGAAPPSSQGVAPPTGIGGTGSKQDIADYIINKALSEGYSRDQANQILTQAVGESNLTPGISGGQQGDDEVIGIFQEKGAFARAGGIDPSQRADAKSNIDAYFSHMAAAGGPAAFTDPAQFLGRTISGGGPYHPENQAKGHLTRAQAEAQQYIAGYRPPAGAPGQPPVTPADAVQIAPGTWAWGGPSPKPTYTSHTPPGAVPGQEGTPQQPGANDLTPSGAPAAAAIAGGAASIGVGVGGLTFAGPAAVAAAGVGVSAPMSGQEDQVDYTKGAFVKTADGKYVMVPPGADPRAMLSRFPGGSLVDASKNPLPAPAAAPKPPAQVQGGAPTAAAPFTPVPYGLPTGTNTGGYGSPQAAQYFPPWLLALGAQFNVKPSTYPEHQESDRFLRNGQREPGYAPNPQHQNRGVDWVGSREDMERFAQALLAYGGAEGQGGGLEQVIYQAGPGGTKYGLGGAGNVAPGYYPQSGEGSYDEHGGTSSGAHVHTRFSTSVPLNLAPPGQQQVALRSQDSPLPPGAAPAHDDDSWMRLPAGADPNQPIPNDVRQQHGIPDNVPPIYYASPQAPNLANVAAVPGSAAPTLQPGQPNLTAPNPAYFPNYQQQPGDNFTGPFQGPQAGTGSPFGAQSPLDTFSSVMSSVGSIAGDAFTVFGDVIKSIGAAANITDQFVRGFANTNDVFNFISQIQTFITTAADISKLVSDTAGTIASFVGAGASADPSGSTAGVAAAFGTVSAIAGLITQTLQAVNEGITLTEDVVKQGMKYGAAFAGNILGNKDTGALSGNVRMLLNTNTGQIYAYSEDNPLNKATHNLPTWMARAYGGPNPNAQPNTQTNILNQYVGPGQTPVGMMSDSMWLVSTGAPAVASVAGQT